MAVSMKTAVFWVVAPGSLVDFYQTTRRYNPEESHLQTFPRLIIALSDRRNENIIKKRLTVLKVVQM
jgi:hypothetical protein